MIFVLFHRSYVRPCYLQVLHFFFYCNNHIYLRLRCKSAESRTILIPSPLSKFINSIWIKHKWIIIVETLSSTGLEKGFLKTFSEDFFAHHIAHLFKWLCSLQTNGLCVRIPPKAYLLIEFLYFIKFNWKIVKTW